MTPEATAELGPGAVLSDRFRVTDALAENAWRGVEVASGREVVVHSLGEGHARSLTLATTLEHEHLARVIDVLELGGRHLVVTEWVPGVTLRERLEANRPVDAVRVTLRVADALARLHERSAVHGLVQPESLVLEAEGRVVPVLTFAPLAPGARARAPGGSVAEPKASDDAWAVAALLHTLLVGEPPPEDGYVQEADLTAKGVHDPALRSSLMHGLSGYPVNRFKDLRPLRRELARWFVLNADGGSIPPGPSSSPPPLPESPAPLATATATAAPSSTASAAPRRNVRHLGALVAGAIGLGLVGGGVFSSLRPKREIVRVVTRAPAASSGPDVALAEIAVTGYNDGGTADRLGSCVAGYLPPNTFGTVPDVSFVCDETNPRDGADKLRVAVVAGAPRGTVTDSMKIFARIGWYDMAAFAVLRAGCCPDAPPMRLEMLGESCTRMDESLREIGEAVVSMESADEALKRYTDSIHCELNLGHGKALRRKERPAGGEDTAFLELVKKLGTQ